MIINPSNEKERKFDVITYIKENKLKRVIDIGGSMNSWASEVVTHYFDLKDPREFIISEDNKKNIEKSTFIYGNISEEESWNKLRNETYMPFFDFVICTQTLEDIRNPSLVLKWLPRIAKEGFIDVPSKYVEMCKGVECCNEYEQGVLGVDNYYRGYMHHRWIFSIINDELVLFPKLPVLEMSKGFEWATMEERLKHSVLSFFWKDNIPFKIMNNDWLGPHPIPVLNMYRNLLLPDRGL